MTSFRVDVTIPFLLKGRLVGKAARTQTLLESSGQSWSGAETQEWKSKGLAGEGFGEDFLEAVLVRLGLEGCLEFAR